jgi:hypothetical protein
LDPVKGGQANADFAKKSLKSVNASKLIKTAGNWEIKRTESPKDLPLTMEGLSVCSP